MGEIYEDKDLEASLSLSAGCHYGSRVRTIFERRPSFLTEINYLHLRVHKSDLLEKQ